jgi:hypothetical protein
MGILDSLLGRKKCFVCNENVDATDASKILSTSRDITASANNYGYYCNKCKEYIHYKCCKNVEEIENGIKVKTCYCVKCNKPLLFFFPKA